MDELATALLLASGAGLAIPLGGLVGLSRLLFPNWLDRELRHSVLALGGGILLSAVGLVLVPHGSEALAPLVAVCWLIAGGACFMVCDRALAASGTQLSVVLATLLDFAPEAMALGAVISADSRAGRLLAVFIALQNLPEGFNAFNELTDTNGIKPGNVMLLLLAYVAVGPICCFLGWWLLSGHPAATGAVMLFAAGGILYLVFQDIAPQAKLENHWGPPFVAVLGCCLGVLGDMLL